jgi:hypothetical protein
VIGGNKGGVVALVEGLKAFVPFSQVSSVSSYIYSFFCVWNDSHLLISVFAAVVEFSVAPT